MDRWMEEWMDGWVGEWESGMKEYRGMDVMDVCVDGWMDGMYPLIHPPIYPYIHPSILPSFPCLRFTFRCDLASVINLICICIRMDGFMDECMNGRTDRLMSACVHGCMDA